MKRNLIFHAGCPDGFGAAWAARRTWGDDARYIPRSHDDDFDPERFEDELVVFADIYPTNPLLRRLGEVAGELLVLDHHLTARDHFGIGSAPRKHADRQWPSRAFRPRAIGRDARLESLPPR